MSNAAIFHRVGQPLELTPFDLPDSLAPGQALCKIRMATICGSDLHTIHGRRAEPAPLILGHEILGEIIALGEGVTQDFNGQPLRVGDRVSWTIMACCGACFFCAHDLPQKCLSLRKYGHMCCDDAPHLTGGFAEHIVLMAGTGIFKVPDALPDTVATPANCALATVINGLETIGLEAGETVLIQGAGLLGLNLIALCKEAGAANVLVTDVAGERLAMARAFGADQCFNLATCTPADVTAAAKACTDGRGADVAFEVCGQGAAVAQGIDALRIGGRYLIAGLVAPGQGVEIDGNTLTRKTLTIKGIHNYAPKHLGVGLDFLARASNRYPYDQIVTASYPLTAINEAVDEASTGKYIRVAVVP
jgi:putative phosphonate catabolism associated alcohol dehydrogenase